MAFLINTPFDLMAFSAEVIEYEIYIFGGEIYASFSDKTRSSNMTQICPLHIEPTTAFETTIKINNTTTDDIVDKYQQGFIDTILSLENKPLYLVLVILSLVIIILILVIIYCAIKKTWTKRRISKIEQDQVNIVISSNVNYIENHIPDKKSPNIEMAQLNHGTDKARHIQQIVSEPSDQRNEFGYTVDNNTSDNLSVVDIRHHKRTESDALYDQQHNTNLDADRQYIGGIESVEKIEYIHEHKESESDGIYSDNQNQSPLDTTRGIDCNTQSHATYVGGREGIASIVKMHSNDPILHIRPQ